MGSVKFEYLLQVVVFLFTCLSYFYFQIPVISPYTIQIVTYIGVGISLAILLAAVISFTCLRYGNVLWQNPGERTGESELGPARLWQGLFPSVYCRSKQTFY